MKLQFVKNSYFKQLFHTLRPKFQNSKNKIFVTSHFSTLYLLFLFTRVSGRGGARGGLGGYSPPSEHASPPSEGEMHFLEIFGIHSTLKTIFLAPSYEELAPRRKIPGATPGFRYGWQKNT